MSSAGGWRVWRVDRTRPSHAPISGWHREWIGVAFGLCGNILSCLWKSDVELFGRGAAVNDGEIRNEHGRHVLQLRSVTTAEVDIDAVHVHLAIADAVEPGPSHDGMAVLDPLRYGERELIDTLRLI